MYIGLSKIFLNIDDLRFQAFIIYLISNTNKIYDSNIQKIVINNRKAQIIQSMKIGIVGLGLIGGSLGLRLQSLNHTIYGIANNEFNEKKAKDKKLANFVSCDLSLLKKNSSKNPGRNRW